jgi:hypothetical protein
MGLEFEHQFHAKGDKRKLRTNLRDNGASEAEIDFMFADFDETRSTRRVELNAMTAPQFIEFLERKLQEHGIEKVVPDHDDLEKAYKFFVRNLDIEKMIENEIKKHKFDADAIKVPDNLTEQVEKVLSEHPRLRWDRAVYKIAGGNLMVEAEPEKPKPGPTPPKPKPAAMSGIVKVLGEVFHAPPEVAAAWATLTKADLRREKEAYKRGENLGWDSDPQDDVTPTSDRKRP